MPPLTDTDNNFQLLTTNDNNLDQYRIRPMTDDDIETVIKIDQDIWKDQAWPIDAFFDSLDSPTCNCWILETTTNDHSIIGYGMQEMSDKTSHITNLTLHPNQCGRGLGGLLLRHMIDHARQFGSLNVILEVHIWNVRAFNLYTKHGFAIKDYLDKYYTDQTDGYLMELLL